jgi:hypothetical protein
VTSMMLWPILSTDLARSSASLTYAIRLDRGGTAATVNFPTLTALRYYWFAGDDQADSAGTSGENGLGDLCALLETALNTHPSGAGFTVTLSVDNIITIANSTAFRVLWNNAATTLDATVFGFAQTDPGATATTAVGATQTRGAWCPRRAPGTDTRDVAGYTTGVAVSLSGRTRIARHATARAVRELTYDLLAERYALTEYAPAAEPTGTLEHVWSEALSLGRPVRYYEDEGSRTSTSYRLYTLQAAALQGGDRRAIVDRSTRGARLRWDATLPLRRVVL